VPVASCQLPVAGNQLAAEGPRRARPRNGNCRSGITLIELVVVIALMSLMLAVGVGVWIRFRQNSTGQEAHARLAAMARRARVFALEESAESRMILDVKNRSFRAEGLRLLGMWQMEGASDQRNKPGLEVGFAGRELSAVGAIYRTAAGRPVDGYRGGGVFLTEASSLFMTDPAFVFPAGGELSCYLRPERDSKVSGRRQSIFTRGKELQFFINIQGELEARSGSATFSTGHRLAVGRWSHVKFSFGPAELSVAVDGVVRGRLSPGDLPSRKEDGLPIVLGGDGEGQFPFVGTVDEPAIRRMVREEPYTLPGHIELVAPTPEVRFAPDGMLDRRYHAGPVRMGVRLPDESAPGGAVTRWVTVTMNGEVREQ